MRNVLPKALIVVAVVLCALSLGFMVYDSTDPWTLEQSVENSEVVSDAALTTDGERLYLNISVAEDAQQNDRYCISNYNPATKTTQTTCYDDWHGVDISSATMVKVGDGFFAENEQVDTTRVSNGESSSLVVPWEEGEYFIQFESERGWVTTLTIHVEKVDGGYEITGSNWNNEV